MSVSHAFSFILSCGRLGTSVPAFSKRPAAAGHWEKALAKQKYAELLRQRKWGERDRLAAAVLRSKDRKV